MQGRKIVGNQQKQKKITSILEAWLHYIRLEDMTQAEVFGKDINEEEITLSGDRLLMSQSAYNKLQDKKAKDKNPDEFALALSFPQIYYIEKRERKFTPIFGIIVTEILSEGYKPKGWDLSKCEFQAVTKNLERLFFMDENDIEQLVTGEGIHRFLRLTFGLFQATLLSEIGNEIQLPVEQINNFKICYLPYLFKFENTNFNFNLKRDIKEIKKKGQSWAIPGHPAYEYLFGKPQPYKLETVFLGAFPIEFPPTDSQAEVLKHAKDNPITAVQGPPGSGKTTLILHLIAQQVTERAVELAQRGKDKNNLTVIASSNNRAVKNVVERLAKEMGEQFLFLEGGSKDRIRGNTLPQLKRAIEWLNKNEPNRGKLQALEQQLLTSAQKFLQKEQTYKSYQKKPKWYIAIIAILKRIIRRLNLSLPQPLNVVLENLSFNSNDNFYSTFYNENYHKEHSQLFIIAQQYLHQLALQNKLQVLTALETYSEFLAGDWDAKRTLEGNYHDYLSNISLVFPVITSTLHSVLNMLPFPDLYCVDQVVIDEAGMIPQHLVFPLLVRGRRAIVVGDPLQIEPVVQHSAQTLENYKKQMFIAKGLEELDYNRYSPAAKITGTAYHRAAGASGDIKDIGSCIMLREHFRCQKPIAKFCNQIVGYGFEIKTPDKKPQFGRYLIACHVDGKLTGKVNLNEVEVVETLIQFLQTQGYQLCNSEGESDIGVISPFRAQADQLQRKLESKWPELKGKQAIGTVHTFQGGEKKVIIFSTRVCQPQDKSINFVNGRPNLLNVAVSRAKELFILVGNIDRLLEAGGYTRQLVKYIERHGYPFPSISDLVKKIEQT